MSSGHLRQPGWLRLKNQGKGRPGPVSHNHLPDALYRNPAHSTTTMSRRELQETLRATDGKVLAAGQFWEIRSRSLGAGIYEVRLRLRQIADRLVGPSL